MIKKGSMLNIFLLFKLVLCIDLLDFIKAKLGYSVRGSLSEEESVENEKKPLEINNSDLFTIYEKIEKNISYKDIRGLHSTSFMSKAHKDLNLRYDAKYLCFERSFFNENNDDIFDKAIHKLFKKCFENVEIKDKYLYKTEKLFESHLDYFKTPELRLLSLDYPLQLLEDLTESIFPIESEQACNDENCKALYELLTVFNVCIVNIRECVSENNISIDRLCRHESVLNSTGNLLFNTLNTSNFVNIICSDRLIRYYSAFNMILLGIKMVKVLFNPIINFKSLYNIIFDYSKQRFISIIRPLILLEDNIFQIIKSEIVLEDKTRFYTKAYNGLYGMYKRASVSNYYSDPIDRPGLISHETFQNIGLRIGTISCLNQEGDAEHLSVEYVDNKAPILKSDGSLIQKRYAILLFTFFLGFIFFLYMYITI